MIPRPVVRRDGDERRPLAQPPLELGPDVLDRHLRNVPLREHDERRALRLARDVGGGEVALDDPLARVDQHERDVGALGGLERAQLRVVLDPLALLALAAQAGGVDQQERAAVVLEHGVDRVARRARHLRDDRALGADERVEERRLADVRPAEDRDADRLVAETCAAAVALSSQPRDDLVEQVAGVVCRACPRAASGRRGRAGGTRARASPAPGRRSCSRARAPACASCARISASSSSPGVTPARASTTKSTRSASAIAARACSTIERVIGSLVGDVDAAGVDRAGTACRPTRRRAPCGRASSPASRARPRRASRSAG